MSAESTNKSLTQKDGTSLPPSAQDVAALSIPIDKEFSKKHLLILLNLFQELLNNTCSPDLQELAILSTIKKFKNTIDPKETEEIARKFMSVRHRSIIDSMF